MAERPAKSKRSPKGGQRWFGVVDRLIPLLVLAVGLCLLRLLFGLITKEYASFPLAPDGTPLTPDQQADLRHTAFLTIQVLAGAVWGLALLCFLRFYAHEEVALGFGALGLLFAVVLPWLARGNTPPDQGSVLAAVTYGLALTGRVLIALSVLRFAAGLSYHVFVRKPQSRRARFKIERPVFTGKGSKLPPTAEELAEKRQRPSAFRHCWELSQCKGSLRVNCPNFREHTDCWKRGSGCQCDPGLASRLVEELELEIAGARSEIERRAAERMKENVSFRARQEAGKQMCHQCELFAEHQAHKFKALYWIAYPVAIAATVALLPLINGGYEWLMTISDTLFGAMQILPDNRETFEAFVPPAAQYSLKPLFILGAGLIIVSYLIDGMDYLIFEVKV